MRLLRSSAACPRRVALASLGCLVAPGALFTAQATPPRAEGEEFERQLLNLALQKANWKGELLPWSPLMLQGRAIEQLAAGKDLRVLWTMSSAQREQRLRPVRIPVDMGLLGWRVLVVRREALPRFAQVRGLADLARLRGVQGHDWPDLDVLRANGLQVDGVTGRDAYFANLFEMLQRGRVDYFPRSVMEVHPELAVRGREDLAIEPRLLLTYPAPAYFFVNPRDDALADALERGLNEARRDGSFGTLFRKHHCRVLRSLNLDQRLVLRLDNPALPKATPLARKDLWLQPQDLAHWTC